MTLRCLVKALPISCLEPCKNCMRQSAENQRTDTKKNRGKLNTYFKIFSKLKH